MYTPFSALKVTVQYKNCNKYYKTMKWFQSKVLRVGEFVEVGFPYVWGSELINHVLSTPQENRPVSTTTTRTNTWKEMKDWDFDIWAVMVCGCVLRGLFVDWTWHRCVNSLASPHRPLREEHFLAKFSKAIWTPGSHRCGTVPPDATSTSHPSLFPSFTALLLPLSLCVGTVIDPTVVQDAVCPCMTFHMWPQGMTSSFSLPVGGGGGGTSKQKRKRKKARLKEEC